MAQAKLQQRVLGGLDRLAAALAWTGLRPDFIRFGIVGSLGFCWDTATVYGLRSFLGLYLAGIAGFFVAATANWVINRAWTFSHKIHESAHRQWAKFLLANLAGFILNRGSFFILISYNNLCHRQPVLAIIFGSFCGLTINYFLSKKYVFN